MCTEPARLWRVRQERLRQYAGDDEEKAIRASIDGEAKALELEPNYSSDLGMKVALRSTSNEAFRKNLKEEQRRLEKLLVERKLKEESAQLELLTGTPASVVLPEFNKITTKSAGEAAKALCKDAVHAVAAISDAKVRKYYLDVASG